MEKSIDIGLVMCSFHNIDAIGNIIFNTTIQKNYKNKERFFKELIIHNIVAGGGSCSLIRRDCFDKIGLLDEDLWIGEDWDLWIRIVNHYELKFVEEPLVKCRMHGNNLVEI